MAGKPKPNVTISEGGAAHAKLTWAKRSPEGMEGYWKYPEKNRKVAMLKTAMAKLSKRTDEK